MASFHHRLLSLAFAALIVSSCLSLTTGDGTCNATAIQFTTTDALGPFYLAKSPVRAMIAPRELLIDPTNVFTVHGKVLGNDCIPLANARVEAWYAGEIDTYAGGDYSVDATGDFRGQVVADGCGNFQFTQTFPAIYPSRPIPHIHYKISSAEGTQLLVTQLYFEGVIPMGFNPDETKISPIVNEADGSQSAEFNIYVSIPGTAGLEACEFSGEAEYLFVDTDSTVLPSGDSMETMLPSDNETMNPSDAMETMVPSEGASEGSIVENVVEGPGEQCGSIVCDPGLVCCNASCGTCTEPGTPCRQVGCVGPTPEDVGTGVSASKNLFD